MFIFFCFPDSLIQIPKVKEKIKKDRNITQTKGKHKSLEIITSEMKIYQLHARAFKIFSINTPNELRETVHEGSDNSNKKKFLRGKKMANCRLITFLCLHEPEIRTQLYDYKEKQAS
jgi:hypothetical protein